MIIHQKPHDPHAHGASSSLLRFPIVPAVHRKHAHPAIDIFGAARYGNAYLIGVHLENGVDIDTRDSLNGCTPLHCAASAGHLGAVKILLDNGAGINLRSRNGLTAIHFAAMCSLEDGGNPVQVVRLLLERGARLDILDGQGSTALHHAVFNGQYFPVIEILLDYGVDVDVISVVDNVASTAYELALDVGDGDVIDLLEQVLFS